MGSRILRHLGLASLIVVFLVAIATPRFGLMWHTHDDGDHDHDHGRVELPGLLGMFHEEHARQHVHSRSSRDSASASVFDADTSKLHGHYVADTLLVYGQIGGLSVVIGPSYCLPLGTYHSVCMPLQLSLLARSPPSLNAVCAIVA